MKNPWTIGPWTYDEKRAAVRFDGRSNPTEGNRLGMVIAEAKYRPDGRLMAASIDLYERLEDMTIQHKCGCLHPACKRCHDDKLNEAALKKARGENA